jgi:hypothetical protein
MKNIFKIIIIFYLLTINLRTLAAELVVETSVEKKNIFKTLTRKSLTKLETVEFLSKYIIIIDDRKNDGLVVYYFDGKIYKIYKDLELISEDKWDFTMNGYLKIFDNKNKEIWKIQPSKENTINIKRKSNLIGKLYEFSYKDKTDFYLSLEQKKLNPLQ